jgi:hypothetical protein
VSGCLLQILGVAFARAYVIAKLRNEAPGKLGQLGARLIQNLRAAKSRARRLLGFKPRPWVHDAKGPIGGDSSLNASPDVVLSWSNGSTEESIAELRRVAQSHQEAIDELRWSMQAQGIQIGQLRIGSQLDIAKAKEQMMTDDTGNASAVCIGLGIPLAFLSSIIGTIWL